MNRCNGRATVRSFLASFHKRVNLIVLPSRTTSLLYSIENGRRMKMKRHHVTKALGLLLMVMLFITLRSLVERRRAQAKEWRNRQFVTVVEEGNREGIKYFTSLGVESTSQLDFLLAILNKNPTAVKKMITSDNRVNLRSPNGDTPLIYAAKFSTVQIAKILLQNGAQVNTKGEGGRTALMNAAYNKDLEMTKLLLTSQADATVKDDGELSALDWAADDASREALEITKLLKKAGAKEIN
jgi:hypothetical protein